VVTRHRECSDVERRAEGGYDGPWGAADMHPGDSLVDLLIQLVHKIGVRAEKKVNKVLVEDVKRVAGAAGQPFDYVSLP